MSEGMFGPNSRFVQHMETFNKGTGEAKPPLSSVEEMSAALKALHSDDKGPVAEKAGSGPG